MPDTLPTRNTLQVHQLVELRQLIAQLMTGNAFYAKKLNDARLTATRLDSLETFVERMPFTTKKELIEDQQAHPPYGTNLTYALSRYTKFSQTSGTIQAPLRWLDTSEDWQWMVNNWVQVYQAAAVVSNDRVCFAFSFGPFLGFWTAFDAATKIGCLTLPGGGLTSVARLRMMIDNAVTVLCCTPTYALRLLDVAREERIDLGHMKLKSIFVAGEPGGCLPAFRTRLESVWPRARIFDQHGMTEVGPVTYQCPDRPGTLVVMEMSYFAEVIDPKTLEPVPHGEIGELVLTTLGRAGSPLLRYRTGDLVRPTHIKNSRTAYPCLGFEGGIIGRTDDMVSVRGVNVYPSAIDQIVRTCEGIAEYRVEVRKTRSMTELNLLVEPDGNRTDGKAIATRLSKDLQSAFALRIPVSVVPRGLLPRFEMKAERWVKINEAEETPNE